MMRYRNYCDWGLDDILKPIVYNCILKYMQGKDSFDFG